MKCNLIKREHPISDFVHTLMKVFSTTANCCFSCSVSSVSGHWNANDVVAEVRFD